MIEMELNIGAEIDKLNEFINHKNIPLFRNYNPGYICFEFGTKIKYLLYVLTLTRDHPKIEIYLKQLLKNYDISELKNYSDTDFTVLQHMVRNPGGISLNSFETILNFGININSQNIYKNTPLHLADTISTNIANIMSLFVKYGADLNILNYQNRSVLDVIAYHSILNRDTKLL